MKGSKQQMEQMWYGASGVRRLAVYKQLSVGRLQAELLEDGTLRNIRVDGEEVLRSLFPTFRDANWGTVPAMIQEWQVDTGQDGFEVSFTAEHRNDSVHYTWQGHITGSRDGRLRYTMRGVADTEFWRNRIGFCVLHPMELAGCPLRVVSAQGTIESRFFEAITPEDPFTDIEAMQYALPSGCQIGLRFEGERFHMEDQRNWTDASYKTFCTPLHLPYPVRVRQGECVEQAVELKVLSTSHSAKKDEGAELRISVGSEEIGRLPLLGTRLPPTELTPAQQELLKKLPMERVRAQISLEDDGWRHQLDRAAKSAASIGVQLELEVWCAEEEGIQQFVEWLSRSGISLAQISVYPLSGFRLPEPVPVRCELYGASYRATQYATLACQLRWMKSSLMKVGLSIPVGGGSRTHFTEFNRAELPLDEMDFAEYAIHPQEHAFDPDSLVETLGAQASTVQSAKLRLHESGNEALPLQIGSVTFKKRLNPYAAEEAAVRQSMEVAQQVDPRQHALFGAGWTVGSLHQLSRHGVAAVHYYDVAGPLGILPGEGKPLPPVYHVFGELQGFEGGELCSIGLSAGSKLEGLAVRQGDTTKLLVANLTEDQQVVHVRFPASHGMKIRVRFIDDRTEAIPYIEDHPAERPVHLRPYAVAVLTIQSN